MQRHEIDSKYKWDLSAIYESDEAFFADCKELEELTDAFGAHEKTMLNSAAELLSALRALREVSAKIEKLWCYAYLTFTTDTSKSENQARVARVRTLAAAADAAMWFVSPYIIRLDEKTVDGWYGECPELLSFKRMIDKGLREKPYVLSDECEKLMAKLTDCVDSHDTIRGIFANSDLRFGKIRGEDGKLTELRDTNYVMHLMSQNRRVRQAAFTTLYKTYEQFGNTFGTLYSAYVKEQTTFAKIRGYKNSITASTFKDEVTPVIYNSLIKSVKAALPTLYDYYELKREVLGLSKLHMYDLYAPLVGEFEREYSYEEAVSQVLDVAKVFGDEYYNTLKVGLCERGWVDVYPSVGKQGGAFSAGCPDTEPYILLNFNGTFNDVSTLAHEAGHSMHSYFSRKYNEPQNSQYTIFVAEVASTVNELLLAHKKLRESTADGERLSILDGLMETYKGTLFRQTMFAEFERDMHAACEQGEPLTADYISTRYKKLVNKYFGPKVVKDRQISYEWMRIPHFYSAFYVYKYATCISAASAIVKRIETEGESYVPQYIEFLKCGGSKSPLESLLVAGIDMSDPTVVDGATRDFESAIGQFREIYNKNK